MPAFLERLTRDRHQWGYFVRYAATGLLVASIDLGLFSALIASGLYRPLATTLSFLTALSVHFTLSRTWTFKGSGRPLTPQVGMYLTVIACSFIVQQGVIEGLVRYGNWPATHAKIAAIIAQTPISFFGHRYLTFGAGLARLWRAARFRFLRWMQVLEKTSL